MLTYMLIVKRFLKASKNWWNLIVDWNFTNYTDSDAASWCGRVGFSPPGIREFSSTYSNQGGGADYTQHITACPPGFENLAASLTSVTAVTPKF